MFDREKKAPECFIITHLKGQNFIIVRKALVEMTAVWLLEFYCGVYCLTTSHTHRLVRTECDLASMTR